MIRKLAVCLLLADVARRATNRAYELGHRQGFALGQLDGTAGTLSAIAEARGGAR